MDLLKTFLIVSGIVSQSVAMIASYPGYSSNNWNLYPNNQFQKPTETFSGPSSYATSFSNNFPSSGNYGLTLNLKNPLITSSYSTYGPSAENAEFGSTTYINYPPQSVQSSSNGQIYQQGDHSFLQPLVNLPSMSGQRYPSSNSYSTSQSSHIPLQGSYYHSSEAADTSQPSYFSSSSSENGPAQSSYNPSADSAHESSQASYSPSSGSSLQSSIYPSRYGFTSQVGQPQNQYYTAGIEEPALLSQHFEVTKPVVVPVYKKFPYAVNKRFPVAIPHPVLVPVPHPYPVNVQVSHPVAVPVIKEIKVPIEKEVLYPVEKHFPVHVEKPVSYQVEKHYPVYVNKPYPVKIPIIKTIIHKSKKW